MRAWKVFHNGILTNIAFNIIDIQIRLCKLHTQICSQLSVSRSHWCYEDWYIMSIIIIIIIIIIVVIIIFNIIIVIIIIIVFMFILYVVIIKAIVIVIIDVAGVFLLLFLLVSLRFSFSSQ